MEDRKQFILWIPVQSSDRPGKTDKLPVDPRTFRVTDAHNPAAWLTRSEANAIANASGGTMGVGFVFTAQDPYWFLDIDHALLDDGTWSPAAMHFLSMFPGAYVEVSYSGTGLHIIGSSSDIPAHGTRNRDYGIEFYHEKRFCALTGIHASGSADTDFTQQIRWLVAEQFPAPAAPVDAVTLADGPSPDWVGPSDDTELLKRALRAVSARSAFGGAASFADLWEARADVLANVFPANNVNDPYDRSSADAALAQHLAFWTGRDQTRMARLMRGSKLVRPKWTEHKSYLTMTIKHACDRQVDVYKQKQKVESEPVSAALQFMSIAQQVDLFKGCTYIEDVHMILTSEGTMLDSSRFRVKFGGYIFALDAQNDKTTRNAWEAFTECQGYRHPRVHGTIFRPKEQYGAIIEQDGRTMINVYQLLNILRIDGDVSPFTDLLHCLFPDARDYRIITTYLAALVQHQGTKFQWCPIIQGVEGNGKTFIAEAIAEAVGRRYTHFPNTGDLAGNGMKFNSWIRNKVFICFEEIYIDRRELSEPLKAFVTNKHLDIQAKGENQRTEEVCANFLMLTNHKDAHAISFDTRRYAVFYTAQQGAADLKRCGMHGDYFPRLYEWFRNGGSAIISNWLWTFDIDEEFNPAGYCQRAPITSSTADAVVETMGSIEQEIQEAIEAEMPGFCGGWVSSIALEKLLIRMRADRRISPNKRRTMMRSLGYEWHPGLSNGRLNAAVPFEGGRPKLFARLGHPIRELRDAGNIAKHYMTAQGYMIAPGDAQPALTK